MIKVRIIEGRVYRMWSGDIQSYYVLARNLAHSVNFGTVKISPDHRPEARLPYPIRQPKMQIPVQVFSMLQPVAVTAVNIFIDRSVSFALHELRLLFKCACH